MDGDGVRRAVEWAAREGWDPGKGDADAFFAADPGGFFESVGDGRAIATLSVVRASPRVAFVGLYIVDPTLRGQGHGKALWDSVLSRFEGVTLALDAVPEQVSTYARDGFEPAHGNARYSATSLPRSEVRSSVGTPDGGTALVEAGDASFDSLTAFDAAHFFGSRPDFLRQWISGPGRSALVSLLDGRITGFAAMRPSESGHRVGPVFADEPDLARELILALAERATGRVAVDVPLANPAAVALVESLGMERSFETVRMYRGDPPVLPLDRVFGITTLELG